MLTALLPPDSSIASLWAGGALALGLILGSFANVCIHRLPSHTSVVWPRSRCPRCQAPIASWDNVPVLSYLLLRGRCRACRAPISLRYPAVEAANGLLYLGLALRYGPSPRALLAMLFATAMIVLALIDFEHQLLPDRVTLPGLVLSFFGSFLPGEPAGPAPLGSLAAAAGGYAAFALIAYSYLRTRGIEGLGQGDWKMAAMLGAFFGWRGLLLTVFAAALCGTLVGVGLMVFRGRGSQQALPLGTFLSLAALAVLFAGGPVLDWYGGLLP
jgi:leader peptidase (prepilin peptidase)/N-methyltransferase